MKLEIPDFDLSVDDPAEEQVILALDNLTWDSKSDNCVDLTRSPEDFLQVIARDDGLYDLRFREGMEVPTQQTEKPVSLIDAKAQSAAYMRGDVFRASSIRWMPIQETVGLHKKWDLAKFLGALFRRSNP